MSNSTNKPSNRNSAPATRGDFRKALAAMERRIDAKLHAATTSLKADLPSDQVFINTIVRPPNRFRKVQTASQPEPVAVATDPMEE